MVYSRNTSGERQNRYNLPPRYSGNRFLENGIEISDSELTARSETDRSTSGELSVRGIPNPGAIARQNARNSALKRSQSSTQITKEPIIIESSDYIDPDTQKNEENISDITQTLNTDENENNNSPETETLIQTDTKPENETKTDTLSGILTKLTSGNSDELLIILLLLLLSGDGKENNDIIICLALLLALS